MKKALRKILVLAVCICVFVSSISVSATTTAGYTPYPKIEYSYSSSVSVGTIRYISQISSSSYFYSSYWGGWVSNAYEECGTASISMALSYVGINKTPKNILDKGNGLTYFDGWGVAMQRPSVANGMTNYINGNGKYSPPIVHFTTGYTSGTHYVILIGKVSSSSYLVLDPASNSTWTLSTSDAKYKSIDRVIQYYNPDVSIQQPITETPEIRTDKEVYSPGENVIFIRNEVENTNFYQLIVYYMGGNGEVNEQIYSESMDDVTQKLSFDDDGKYCVYIQAGNAVSGTITSAPYYFYVGNVITETPEISTDKTVYSPGEDVMFIRNEVENTNFYQHIIYYMGINGELNDQFYSESMDDTTCLMSFNDVGKYCVYIQVGNAASGTITSAPYYFYVKNEITEAPTIWSDKGNNVVLEYGTDVVINRTTVENADYHYLHLIYNYSEEATIDMSETSYTLSELDPGIYTAWVTVGIWDFGDEYGSNAIEFQIREPGFKYSINGDVATITGYEEDYDFGHLHIPRSIYGYPITEIAPIAFQGCKTLTTLTGLENVATIGDCAFADCPSLTRVVLNNGVQRIEGCAFASCSALEKVYIPKSVSYIQEQTFDNCLSLNEIDVDEDNDYYCSIDGVLFTKDKWTLIKYPPQKPDSEYNIPYGVGVIYNRAFEECENLVTVNMPDTVLWIGSYCFWFCPSLVNINFGDNVEYIGMGSFYGCSSLKNITIPQSVSSIGEMAFYLCRSLEKIEVEDANVYYSSLNGVLFDENKTLLIAYPQGKTDTYYSMPNDVKKIDSYAFTGNPFIEKIKASDNVTEIGESAFESCLLLKSVNIPNGVETIGRQAFLQCDALESVTMSSAVTVVEPFAFDRCFSLKNIYFSGTEEQWNAINVDDGNECLLNANVIFGCDCPDYENGVHIYSSSVTTAPTCVKKGVKTYVCSCGESYTEDMETIEHNYSSSITKFPTCTTYGIMTYVCTGCTHSYSATISKADHLYSPDYTVDTPATYFTAGIKSRHCLNCTASTDHTVIEPLVPPASLLTDIRKLILKGTNNTQYDYNGDGEVDIRDLVKLKKSYCGIG